MDLAIDKKATETANNLRLFRQQLFKLKTYQQNGSVPETDMAEYLKVSYPYFLYYGSGFFPRNLQETYDKNKDRVYFANSPFSLYARLKELLDYIKYYGK